MVTTEFLEAWAATKREEQGYANNPNDKGGPTNHGITEVVARADGFTGDMRNLPVERAREIAKKQYWDVMRLDDVAAISPKIARELFDSGFLSGINTAAKWLQRLLNVMNREQRVYGDIKTDGVLGNVSIYNLKLYMEARRKDNGEAVMLKALNALQGAYLIGISEGREANEEFIFGWLANRVEL